MATQMRVRAGIGLVLGLALEISVWAESHLEGRVRLSSGQPAAGVQVRLFDWSALRRSVAAVVADEN